MKELDELNKANKKERVRRQQLCASKETEELMK